MPQACWRHKNFNSINPPSMPALKQFTLQGKMHTWPLLTLYRHIRTAKKNKQYGDWYTCHWWVGCYIWYSEEGPRQAAAPPSHLAVPNVTAHPSMAQFHIIRCNTIITQVTLRSKAMLETAIWLWIWLHRGVLTTFPLILQFSRCQSTTAL